MPDKEAIEGQLQYTANNKQHINYPMTLMTNEMKSN